MAGWLEEHHAALRSRLQALRGRVEVGVQILLRDGGFSSERDRGRGISPAGPRGHAYFARHPQRREQHERLEREAEAVFRRHGETLAALVDDVQVSRPRPVPGKMMVLTLLLTDQAGVLRVGEYLEQVSQETDAEVRFTGPWPLTVSQVRLPN